MKQKRAIALIQEGLGAMDEQGRARVMHSLRHGGAVRAAEAGRDVRATTGHKSKKMAELYARRNAERRPRSEEHDGQEGG
jgi:integrase